MALIVLAYLLTLQISDLEWRTLMVGAVNTESLGSAKGSAGVMALRSRPPSLAWLSQRAWDQILGYEATLGEHFSGLARSVELSHKEWKVRQTITSHVEYFSLKCSTKRLAIPAEMLP